MPKKLNSKQFEDIYSDGKDEAENFQDGDKFVSIVSASNMIDFGMLSDTYNDNSQNNIKVEKQKI